MTSWLRNGRDDGEGKWIPPEVDAVLPASVRPPEAHRSPLSGSFMTDDVDNEDDADLEFLTALVREVDRAAPAPPGHTQVPLRGANPRIDDMQVFREMKSEDNKTPRYDHRVRDVEMADLLEELDTVRAAFRRQRAA